jgi:hypothetical protein
MLFSDLNLLRNGYKCGKETVIIGNLEENTNRTGYVRSK